MFMDIIIDDLNDGAVLGLLEEHLRDMYATSPPDSVHALNSSALRSPDITFFSAWIGSELAGCVAIKKLSDTEVELKSMRTSSQFRGQGVATALLMHVLNYVGERDFKRINLETGTQTYFIPAVSLYKKFDFEFCGPFSHYQLDPNSHFMTRLL